jgi:hypothetical protein
MNISVVDTQTIGESDSTIFSMLQQSPVVALLTLRNNGTNTMNYRFQQFNGTAWVDLGSLGTDVNNTLSPLQTRAVSVSSAYPQVRLLGYASGGTALEFAVLRYYERASGGPIPILAL